MPFGCTGLRCTPSRRTNSQSKDTSMFTGIIEELGTVEAAAPRLRVHCSTVMQDLTEGASIAVNGVCLTAVGLRPGAFSADVAPETLRRTNLGELRPGSRVNLERPLRSEEHTSELQSRFDLVC